MKFLLGYSGNRFFYELQRTETKFSTIVISWLVYLCENNLSHTQI